jgi:hypothetical protein
VEQAPKPSCKEKPLTPKYMEEKRKKGGRPPLVQNVKEKRISFSVTQNEYELINQKAESIRLKPSIFCRQLVMKGEVSNLFSEEEQWDKRQLIGMRNNLNQLVRLAHIGGFQSQAEAIDILLDGIDGILNKYNNVSKIN